MGVVLSKISYLILILVNHEGHTKEKQIHQITIKNLIHCNLYPLPNTHHFMFGEDWGENEVDSSRMVEIRKVYFPPLVSALIISTIASFRLLN